MIATDSITPGHIDILQKRLAELRQAIEQENIRNSYRVALGESVTRNLEEMRYKALEPFEEMEARTMNQAVFSIPGGERIRIAIQPDSRLSFGLEHECKGSHGAELTQDEVLLFRAQEDRWCMDFKELLKRLIKEGFQFEIKLERDVPQSSIPIVYHEGDEAAEILGRQLEDEEERERFERGPEKRYLP